MTKLKSIKIGAMILALTITMVGCGVKEDGQATPTPVNVESSGNTEVTNNSLDSGIITSDAILPSKDRAGNDIVIPKDVNRIISLAPSTTQILEDLGVNSRLVAVDNQSPIYSELDENLVQFDLMAPDLEQLLELAPDVVYVSSMTNYSGEDILKVVRDSGIAVIEIPTSNSINDVKMDIQFIADTLSLHDKGEEIVSKMEEEIESIAKIGKGITEKKTVYFEIGAAPYMYSFGSNVFLDELIQILGANNVLSNQEGWLSVSQESIVEANPEVILTNVNYIENPLEELKTRVGFEGLDAVTTNNLYYIDNGHSSLPNHNIVQALKEMAKAIYPEQYKEIE